MSDNGCTIDLGAGLHGYLARPRGTGPHPAVLVYMEAFGLNDYIRSECDRVAALGYVALAPDFFRGDVFSYANFAPIPAKIESIGDAGFLADIRSAIAFLEASADVRHEAYGVVGFCMGGRLAFLTAAELGPKIAACAAFYGGGIAPTETRFGRVPLAPRAAEIDASVVLFYGANDGSIEPIEIARVTEALAAAKKDALVHVFPDAGHGFASRDRDDYVAAVAEEAWAETASLFARTFAKRA